MITVYLWDAGRHGGVTDDLVLARVRAAASMLAGGERKAVVETAFFDDGTDSMDSGYVVPPSGPRLTARLRAGRVTWSDRWVPAAGPEPLRAAS